MPSPNSLRQTTRSLITLAQAQSGKQVIVQDDPALQTYATVQIARGGAPAHVIRYMLQSQEEPDYLISYQCGFIIRKFAVPREEMVDFGSDQTGIDITTRLLRNAQGKKNRLDPERLQAAAKQILDGLMIHLLSTPLGLRVAGWLRQDYPDLIPLQDRQVMREIKLNEQSNTAEVKRRVPKKIFDSTQAINAAYALFWANQLNQPDLTQPYRDHLRDAQALLDILQEVSSEPEHDAALVDAWADYLHLSEWYQWVPFQG